MASCVICFKNSLSCIYVDSNEWHKFNIKPIIEKHLWWWHLKQSSSKSRLYICFECWEMLSAFHTFSLEVEKLHQLYYEKKLVALKGSLELRNCELISNINSIPEEPRATEKDSKKFIPKNNSKIELPEKDETSYSTFNCNNIPEDQIYVSKRATSREDDIYLAQNSYQVYCDLCSTAFNNFKDLKYHCRKAHNVSGYAVCCKKKFYNRGQLADHLRIHENPDYFKCRFCNRVLSHRLSYENHIKGHSQSKKHVLKCAKCNKFFSKNQDYGRHLLTDCPEYQNKSESSYLCNDNTNFISNNVENKEISTVDNGDGFIDERSDYDAIEHNPVLKTESESYSDSDHLLISSTERSNFNTNFENIETSDLCSVVKTEIVWPENGELLNYNSIEESLDCVVRNEATTDMYEQPLQKSTKTKTQRRGMDDEYLEHCKSNGLCNKNPGQFGNHLRLRKNRNYFECAICGKVFLYRTSYEKHFKSHKTHKPKPNKLYCNICGKKFLGNAVLWRHQNEMHSKEMQTEQVCSICFHVSPDMKSHRQHVRYNHTAALKHACHICEKKFRFPAKLKEHISTHTGIPLHACPYCYRPFKSASNMHTHRKRVHPKEWEEGRIKKLVAQKLRKLSFTQTV